MKTDKIGAIQEFEMLLDRKLTEVELLLVKHSFCKGYEQGRYDERIRH